MQIQQDMAAFDGAEPQQGCCRRQSTMHVCDNIYIFIYLDLLTYVHVCVRMCACMC